MEDLTLIQLFAQLDAHTARQDEILAHHTTMLDRMDDRGRQIAQILERSEARDVQHTEAMRRISESLDHIDDRGRQHTDALLQISGNLARVATALDTMEQRHENQLTQMAEILASMAGMLARMDEHTTMIAQILSQFQQGRNGHP